MTEHDDNKPTTGPQGTQVFEVNEINKMIAKEILESQTETANIPALIGVSNDVIGQQFVLDKDKIEIGRRPTSDISLNVSSVSAMHAQVIRNGDEWKVLNLLSSNGTYVNGEKVSEKILAPGDMIAFAGAEFVYSLIDEEKTQEAQSSNNQLLLIGGVLVLALIGLLAFVL